MPGDCRAANRARWKGHRRALTVEACAAVRAVEVLPALRELRPGDRGTTAAGVAFEVLATGLRLTCDPWRTGVAWTR